MEKPQPRHHVVIVGAGAIGATCALTLVQDGWEVTVVDQGPDWANGCSAGNAGLVCTSHSGRWARRADILRAARWILDPEGALRIRPTPAVVSFLTKAITLPVGAARRADELSRQLCAAGWAGHERLIAAGTDWGLKRDGLLDVFRTLPGLALARTHLGPTDQVLDGDEARTLEPTLGQKIVGALWRVEDGHGDPVRYVGAVGKAAVSAGAKTRFGTTARGIERRRGRLKVTVTDQEGPGELWADRVLLAAGAGSTALSRGTIRTDTLQPGRGQSVDLQQQDRAVPTRPLILREDRVALTPLDDRLRVAGQMEFGARDGIDRRRLTAMRRHAETALPGWSSATGSDGWTGGRPCTPDGNPLIGWLDPEHTVAVATGHAMLGLTLAPVTGELVGSLLGGRTDDRLNGLDPRRFH